VSSSVLAGLAFVAVVASFFYLRAKTQEIHVLVNRRLELELQEIRDLKTAAAQQESGSAPVTPSDAGRADDG
jgi:hypothetical protein